jgi:hypothetical protein
MCKTTADQHPLEYCQSQKNWFPEVFCVPVEYRWSKNLTATLSGTPLLQRAVELHRWSLILSRCLPELPLVEMELQKGAPVVYFHHAGATCSSGDPPPRGNPGLKRTWTGGHFEKIRFKNELKVNVQRDCLNFRSIQ